MTTLITHLSPDAVNGTIEAVGACLQLFNIKQLHQDKQVKGVHWAPVVFFTSWGLWNLFYYPALSQPISFNGAVCLVVTNATWLCQITWYLHQEKKQQQKIQRARQKYGAF